MSTASSLVRALIGCAVREGERQAELLDAVAFDAATLDDPDARVPTASYLELFELCASRSRDPMFGSTVGAAIDREAFGLLGLVVGSCASLGEAFARFSRYSRLLCDELRFEVVEQSNDEAAVVYHMDASPHVPALFEMAITHLVLTARKGTRGAFTPTRVVFRHRGSARSLARVFGAPAELGGAVDAIFFERAALSLGLRGRNPTLLGVLEQHTAHVLDRLPPEQDFRARVRGAVQALLSRGEPTLELVARRLGMGDRTLQRRLRAEGLTFRELLDGVRLEAAEIQLARRDVSVAEVAFSLGFSDAKSFRQAYRRMTGRAPRG
ncbi:MAG: AraC family transcriptional regulator ligand-binding domain-containing protein [Polyangiaceae bacterium]